MEKENLWDCGKTLAFFGVIFFALMAFFTEAHMLVPYDGDDWANLSGFRMAIPKPWAWNPIKILPEDSFPIIGYIAAYWVMPFTKDYIYSIAFTSAAFVSLVICIYVFLFNKVLQKHFRFNSYEIYALTLAFFLCHFWILKTSHGLSPYLFSAGNLTCFFHYTIPGILNLCLVEYFMAFGLPKRIPLEKGMVHVSLLLLALYLAIFSNVFHSIILIAFIAASVLLEYKAELFSFRKWMPICKENPFLIGIIVVWLLSLACEMNGGRAHMIGASILQLPIKQTMMAAWHTLKSANKICLGLMLSMICISYVLVFFQGKIAEQKERLVRMAGVALISAFFTFAYQLLVCAKAFAPYMARTDILIGPLAFLIMAALLTAAFLLEKQKKLILIAPIILFFMAVEIMNASYIESTTGRVIPRIAYQIDYELIDQIVEADRANKKEMVLRVPKGDNHDNWPHPMYMGGNIAKTLYRHGIIVNQMKIKIQPDVSMNEKYGLPIRK